MSIEVFTGGAFGENAYLVRCPTTDRAVVVDPGAAAPSLIEAARAHGARIEAIVLTHAHLDHVEGVPAVRAFQPDVPIFLHPDDLPLYHGAEQQAAAFGMQVPPLPEPDRTLSDDQVIEVGDTYRLRVRPAPGHAPGHVILIDDDAGVTLVGDVVFQGSIGRTDLPGGDFQTLVKSIRAEVLELPDAMRLLPGHGPPTTVGHERRGNPFLTPHYLGRFA